jgi:regulator of protease activity HflC (stomatin/prohibitin superfamily)
MFKKLGLYGTAVGIIFAFFFGSQLLSTVEKGTFEVRQFPVTGTIDVRSTPGTWCKCFANLDVWKKSKTFKFDGSEHALLPVRFNDGSASHVKGEVRVEFPSSLASVNKFLEMGYANQHDVMERLVSPHLLRVMRLQGNFMTAKESYNQKRAEFDSMSFDQLRYGVYKTKTETATEKDLMTGEDRTREYKIVLYNDAGDPLREQNPLEGTGITFNAYVIESIEYPEVVNEQIEAQRKAIMEVETAIAEAKKSEQDAKTIKMEGEAKVMTAKYEKEQEKVRATVEAEQRKEVAELDAQKRLEVAKLDKLAAEQYKEEQILKGQGEGERKKLVMLADGALEKKLEAWVEVNQNYATAIQEFQGEWVSQVSMGSKEGGNANEASALIDLFTVKTAKDLSLDMSMTGKTKK